MIAATRPNAAISAVSASSKAHGEWMRISPLRTLITVMRALNRTPGSRTGYSRSHSELGTKHAREGILKRSPVDELDIERQHIEAIDAAEVESVIPRPCGSSIIGW